MAAKKTKQTKQAKQAKLVKKTTTKKQTKSKIQLKETKTQKENWLSSEVFLILAIIFFSVQALGLFVAKQLFVMGLAQPPFSSDINDISNAVFLFASIMVMTVFILILLKLRKTKKFLWIVEAMAIFSTCIIVLSTFIPTNDLLVLAITAIILFIRYTNRENVLFRDFVSLIAIAGAGAFIGISLGLLPILAFIIILAIYDIIAVFYTKHMVEIGKQAVGNNFAFTVAIPTKKHNFELGNGDMVIPLMVASSILVNGPFLNNSIVALLCIGASYLGIASSIYIVSVKKIPLPALPPQTLLMVLVIIASIFVGL
ncbi:MAG: presenilin family intramembrane aspartyl protease [archaeon]|jgi:presenilin-like A22 family membrane protease